jgi:small conductance mechanosensitive channel
MSGGAGLVAVGLVDSLNVPEITREALVFGLGVLLVGLVVSQAARPLVRRMLRWRGRSESASLVFARVTSWVLVVASFGAAITVVFPSVEPVNLLGGIGVVSIAAGIAFQTVLGNMFAGLMLLSRDTFNVGDQIGVADVRGTVTGITLNTTTIRTFDGRQVLIPNGTIHGSVVVIQTGYEFVRTSVLVDLDDRTDVEQATSVALEAMAGLTRVASDPAPEALLSSVGTGTLQMELRFWSGARELETKQTQDDVIRAVVRAFQQAGVATGARIHVVEAAPSLERALDQITVLPAELAGEQHRD